MKTERLAGVVIMLAAGLMIAGAAELSRPDVPTVDNSAPVIGRQFQEMLAQVDTAQLELQNGKPAAFKALWSHAEDITLSGGFGGTVEKGWEQISRRLDWVGAQFSQGSNTVERVVANESGDLRYVVQLEHIRFRVPGQTQDSNRDYRVTMIFRREANQWRIVHRQADAQMTKQAPQ